MATTLSQAIVRVHSVSLVRYSARQMKARVVGTVCIALVNDRGFCVN
jgi:hypothetical protein